MKNCRIERLRIMILIKLSIIRLMNSLRSKIVIPFHTPFDALRRYAKVSAYGYPQHISWSKDQCEPYPTEGIKAIPAYLVAGVVVLASVHVTWIGVRKVVSFQKDPELQDSTGLTGLVLIMFQCSATAAAAASLTYAFNANIISRGFRELQRVTRTDGRMRGRIGSKNYAGENIICLGVKYDVLMKFII